MTENLPEEDPYLEVWARYSALQPDLREMQEHDGFQDPQVAHRPYWALRSSYKGARLTIEYHQNHAQAAFMVKDLKAFKSHVTTLALLVPRAVNAHRELVRWHTLL